MPGIAGVVGLKQIDPRPEGLVARMLATMKHKTTYRFGSISMPDLGAYAGWVAHDGSLAKRTNIASASGDVAFFISGEFYTDRDLGSSPDAQNPHWLVQQYLDHGVEFIKSLNGMFSGVILDRRRRRIVIFNDRYGLERIYIYESKGMLYFATEAKALLCVAPELRAFDEEGVAQFLAYGCTLGSKTLFRDITQLPPASCWIFSLGKCIQRRAYFSPAEWESQEALSQSDFDHEFSHTFQRILPRYVTESERLGIALTAGLDTRMIMACLPKLSNPPITYTFSGLNENILDAKIAAHIAHVCNFKHFTLRIGNDFLERFHEWVDRSIYISDGCCGITGAHEIYLNRQAAQIAPIRLTGNFGSEVFRSVSTFKPLGIAPELLSPEMYERVSHIVADTKTTQTHPVTFAAFHEIPWNLVGTLFTGRSEVTFRTPYMDNDLVKLAYRAPTNGRTSPKPAITLVEQANPALAKIATDRGQFGTTGKFGWLLRRIYAEITFKLDYYHKEGLPGKLAALTPMLDVLGPTGMLGRHKYLQYSRWFKSELAPYLRDVLHSRNIRDMPFLNSASIAALHPLHAATKRNYTRELSMVATLLTIDRTLLRSAE